MMEFQEDASCFFGDFLVIYVQNLLFRRRNVIVGDGWKRGGGFQRERRVFKFVFQKDGLGVRGSKLGRWDISLKIVIGVIV